MIIDNLNYLKLSYNEKIDVAAKTEHGMGLRGGIMDQYTILHGQENKALLIDCDKESHTFLDINSSTYQWVLLNTNVKHELLHTPYNNRRNQVEEALFIINEKGRFQKSFKSLLYKDISLIIDNPVLHKRIKHIVTEMQRVNQAFAYLKNGDYDSLGQLLDTSHKSLYADYNVSCEELDFVKNNLALDENVIGSRMMGGGFGGSVIALIQEEYDSTYLQKLYLEKHQ